MQQISASHAIPSHFRLMGKSSLPATSVIIWFSSETLKSRQFFNPTVESFQARVVEPAKADPERAKARIRFKKLYGCTLKFLSTGTTDKIGN